MNPWINYHHLFYFKTIAEEKSISGAARKLRLGQPTLSAQLKQFEEALGVKLFERQTRKLLLTEQGHVALDYAKSIFKLGSEMYEVIHDGFKPQRPRLHIGALHSVPKQIVLKLVQAALKTSPCQIYLSEGRPDELLTELGAHRMDLVLADFRPLGPSAQDLYVQRIGKNPVKLYGAANFQALRRGFPRSISGQPLIVPTYDSKLRYDLDQWARIHHLEMNVLVESQDIAVKKMMAGAGLGLISAASHAVTQQIKEGELFEIGSLSGVQEELFFLAASRKIPNPIANQLFKGFSL